MLFSKWKTDYCSSRDLAPTTTNFYSYGVSAFDRWAKHPVTVRYAAEHLNEFLSHLADTKNRFTAASYRSSVVALLKAAAAEGHCTLPTKIRPIKTPQHRPRGLHPAEINKLVDKASPMQRAGIMLAYDTGYRRGDLRRTRWPDVFGSRDNWRVVITVSKTGQRETRRIRNETYDALDAVRNPDDDRLLPMEVGHSGWRKRWHRLGKDAGVDTRRRGLQAIRRTGASMTKQKGGSAAKYLGHSAKSGDLADRFYIDPELVDEAPPLPPAIL